jgi:SOS-response transcriptional repressor LexA
LTLLAANPKQAAAELVGSGKCRYLLRVVEQSMIGAHTDNGDLLIVEEDEDPPDGEVVAGFPGSVLSRVRTVKKSSSIRRPNDRL